MTDISTILPYLEEEKIFTCAFEHAAIGMALVAPDGHWLMVNQALCELLGYTEAELLKLTFQDITHPDDLELDLHYIKQLLIKQRTYYQKEKRYHHKDGSVIHALLSVSLVRDHMGEPLFFISQIQNITDRKNLETELMKQAKEDGLTGACNRRCFYEFSGRELSRASRYSEPMVLLMIDIDHFKKINDTFGHANGDEALKKMVTTCKNMLRPFDIFGRIGGEEFCALLIKTDAGIGYQVAERLRKAVEEIILPTQQGIIRFTISIGGIAFSGSGQTLEQRMNQADKALYEAKAAGRNRVVMVDELLEDDAKEQLLQNGFVRLQWSQTYESGNRTIDNQHKNMFDRANRLITVFMGQSGKEESLGHINSLLQDISAHFICEEKIMKNAGYPGYEEHKRIHDALLGKGKFLAEKYMNGYLEFTEIFQYLAIEVIHQHLLTEDKKFFPFINS